MSDKTQLLNKKIVRVASRGRSLGTFWGGNCCRFVKKSIWGDMQRGKSRAIKRGGNGENLGRIARLARKWKPNQTSKNTIYLGKSR